MSHEDTHLLNSVVSVKMCGRLLSSKRRVVCVCVCHTARGDVCGAVSQLRPILKGKFVTETTSDVEPPVATKDSSAVGAWRGFLPVFCF